jgi:hypothetical protein
MLSWWMADNFDQTLVDVEGDVERRPFRRVTYAIREHLCRPSRVSSHRHSFTSRRRLVRDRRIPERVGAHPDPSLERAYVSAEDLADADLCRARRLVLVADHPQGHHVHRSSKHRDGQIGIREIAGNNPFNIRRGHGLQPLQVIVAEIEVRGVSARARSANRPYCGA